MKRLSWLALLVALPTWAQEPAQEDPRIEGDYLTRWVEGEESLLYVLNPTMRRGELYVRSDHMIFWGAKTGKPNELYAEGNVVFRRGNTELRAERLYLDLTEDKAYVFQMRARGKDAAGGSRYQVFASEAREIAKGRFLAQDISISTCDYGVPHFDVHLGKGELWGKDERPEKSAYDLFPYDSWELRGRNITPRLFGIPFFFIPGFAIWQGFLEDFPLRSVQGGLTSQSGFFVLTDWGVTLRKGALDRILPGANETEEDDHEKWGEFNWELDWRAERGFAFGIDPRWAWDGYAGYIDTYYLNDLGRAGTAFDQKFSALERPERGRARLFHRHDFLPEWRYEIEASYLSDKDLLEEFFEREFKEEKEQETAAYLRWRKDNLAAYALERHRLNDFQSQLEMMPRLHLQLIGEPVAPSLWDRLLMSHTADLSHMRLRISEGLPGTEERAWRFDSLNELALPLDLRIVSVEPLVLGRVTHYEEDLEGESETRGIGGAGARAKVDVHGVHDLTVEEFGLRKLRHLLSLEARYTYNIDSSTDDSELFRFDEVDRFGEFEEVTYAIRNRFQTKVKEGDGYMTWEFLRLDLEVEYYPNRFRDTASFVESNFAPPFHWIPLARSEPGASFEPRHWSNLHWDLRFQPRSLFAIAGRGEYNPHSRKEEARDLSVGVYPLPGLTVSAGLIFLRGVTDAYSVGLSWRPSEKWTVYLNTQYDVNADAFTQQQLIVGREYHDFILEAIVENDVGRDEQRFYVAVTPKFLGARRVSSHGLSTLGLTNP